MSTTPSPDDSGLPEIESRFHEALTRAHSGVEAPSVHLADGDESTAARFERLAASTEASAQRYVFEEEIGRGGMGAVLKIFDADLRRHLAMKVVLDGGKAHAGGSSLDPRRLSRFLEEAQITGQLDHPGIVPVHELGVDPNGRVYFTMQLVKGQELAKVFDRVHAGDPEWNVTRALGLLLKVCEAMSYAHEKGVVHRDLKPANIMIGRHGEVYVMDWGLARVDGAADAEPARPRPTEDLTVSELRTDRRDAAQREEDSPLLTDDGSVLGTPYYMPPEQAAGRLEDIGPHSDVYALGAMLYFLLSGRKPYQSETERTSPHRLIELVLEGPPEPLATLAPQVPAELEAICEKAMARSIAERYPDMGALAEDLRAFLEHRVVRAYRTGAVVELKKWVRRNAPLAASLAVLVLVVVGGSVAAAIVLGTKNTEVRAARDNAVAAQERAEIAATQEARVTGFLVEQFESLEPSAARGRSVPVDELLDRAARQLDEDVPLDSIEGARLRAVVGTAYRKLGRFEAAEILLTDALAGRRAVLGSDHPVTLEVLDELAVLLEQLGRYDEAESLQVEAYEARRTVLGPDDPATLESMGHLAYLYESQGREDEAEELYAAALEGLRAVLGPEHVETLVAQENLALLYELQDRFEEAEPLLEQVVSVFTATRGDDDPLTLTARADLALLYGSQERYDEAETLYEQVLDGSRRVLGPDHPDTLDTLNNLAMLYEDQGFLERAEAQFREVIEKSRAVLGGDHPDTLVTLTHLTALLAEQGRWAEAEPLARELMERTLSSDPDFELRVELLDRVQRAARVVGVEGVDGEDG